MAKLPPVLGAGSIFLDVLRGSRTYVGDVDIAPPTGIEIQFFSTAGEFIDLIGTTYGTAPHLELSITEEKNGGLVSFTISTSRNIEIPFFNLMTAKILVNGKHWFTGELTFLPDQDRRDVKWEIEGRGFSLYLKDIFIHEVFTAISLTDIVKDIIQNNVAPNSPILYNPSLISLPAFSPTKLELNKKNARFALNEILKIANSDFNNAEYHYGVNINKQFFFLPMETDIQGGFFEGYQFQNPDVETSDDKLVNRIEIYRAIEDSDQVQFVSFVEDSESIAANGLATKSLTIPNFFDTTTAERLAVASIEEFKNPITTVSIEKLRVKESPYLFGPYKINSRPTANNLLVTDSEDLSLWTLNVTNTIVTEETSTVFTGKKAIKAVTTAGSSGETMDFVLPVSVQYPLILRFWAWQNPSGSTISVRVEDEDANGFTTYYDGDLVGDFIKYEIDISSLENLKKIRIMFITNLDVTIYFDRFDCFVDNWKQRELKLQEITYNLSLTSFLATAMFGKTFPSLIDDIKEISEKQANLYGIFEKETP